MKFKKQTLSNNCFATCIANLLDLDIADVPNFCHLHGEETEPSLWQVEAQKWLCDRGWFMVELQWGTIGAPLPESYPVIINGMSARGRMHSVIGHILTSDDGSLMRVQYDFDPHEDCSFLETVELITILIPAKALSVEDAVHYLGGGK